jgi:hypothetical protein
MNPVVQKGETNMRFARWLFLIAGIYGLVVLLPQYFLEAKTGLDYPPPITHPEYYYGFIGLGAAWQVLFLVIAKDPVRYRAMMLPSVLEKFSFGVAAVILFLAGRISSVILGFACADLVLGVLFIAAYAKTPRAT